MNELKLFTIGFTQKTARKFFELLKQSGAKRLIDVRLNNISQLAGFAKKEDLRYFAREIGGLEYVHATDLAPTQDILQAYRKAGGDWAEYEKRFLQLMADRKIEERVDPALMDGGCLLCSEDSPHHCHRRLVAEYLCTKWPRRIRVEHLR